MAFAAAALVGLVLVAIAASHAWTLDERGLSLVTRKPASWDFANLWMGGRLALTQSVEAVFQPDSFRAAMRAAFGPEVQPSEWSYPPGLLLVAAPLSLLPVTLGYALFGIGGVAALLAACRLGGLSWPWLLLIAVSPAVLINAIYGQNGSWTAALLLGGLTLSGRRPILAGLLIGLLTLKPHLGLLVPACLIAAGHWRAFGWAGVFSAAIAALSAVLFGIDAWRLFFAETRPLMQAILEAPWGTQDYQLTGVTVFHLVRALGGGLGLAYGAQLAAAGAALVAACALWRKPDADPFLRAVTTALLTLVASPYGWTYDAIPLGVAAVALAARRPQADARPLALAYLFPALNKRVAYYALPLAPLVIAAMAAACWRAAVGPAASPAGAASLRPSAA